MRHAEETHVRGNRNRAIKTFNQPNLPFAVKLRQVWADGAGVSEEFKELTLSALQKVGRDNDTMPSVWLAAPLNRKQPT